MRFSTLVETSRGVADATGRRDKIGRLAALLAWIEAPEIEAAIAFLSGSPRQGRIGLGPAAISEASKQSPAAHPTLELYEVDAAFERIGGTGGLGSTQARTQALRALLARATADEQDFLIRVLFGELRQGALEGVLSEAVALAARLPADRIRRAVMLRGDLAAVARIALTEGVAGLDAFSIQLFRPIQPMLADSAAEIDAALARLDDAALEFKIDGARIQVHKAGDEVRVFSRGLRDVTVAVPEVVERVRALAAPALILDGEVVALREDATPQPFQVTMRRFGRRLDVERLRRDLPVTPFFFDCLHADGRDLLDEPQAVRFEALSRCVDDTSLVPHLVPSSVADARGFFERALAHGHEGVMAKARKAGYSAGARGASWLKIKRARTLDLVVLAAEWGHGRRSGWLSNLHLGAHDPEQKSFVMLGKTFKGLTDKMLDWQTRRLLALETGRDGHTVHVRPELVVEIAFGEVQRSPQYPGGLALRFARVKRFREDKAPGEADTLATVRAMRPAS